IRDWSVTGVQTCALPISLIQWSPRAWNTILGYRLWPVPSYAARPEFCLIYHNDPDVPGTLIMRTPQFRLIRLFSPVADSNKPCGKSQFSSRQPIDTVRMQIGYTSSRDDQGRQGA